MQRDPFVGLQTWAPCPYAAAVGYVPCSSCGPLELRYRSVPRCHLVPPQGTTGQPGSGSGVNHPRSCWCIKWSHLSPVRYFSVPRAMSDSHASDLQKGDPVAYSLDQRRRSALAEVDKAGFKCVSSPRRVFSLILHSVDSTSRCVSSPVSASSQMPTVSGLSRARTMAP